MVPWKRLALSATVLVWASALTPAFAEGEPTPQHTNGVVRVGDMAPAFTLDTLGGGKPVCLSDGIGRKITVLMFWSYFCFPCQAEMPQLEAFYNDYGPDKIALVAISMDGPAYSNFIDPFIKTNALTFPIAYDRETKEYFEVAEKYGVVGTPTFFVIDDQGRVRFIHLGRLDKDVLRGVVESAKSKSFCAEIVKPKPPE